MLTQEVFLGNDGSPSILLISIIPCPLCECLLSKIFGGCATLMYFYLLGLNKKEKHKYICTTSHVINSFFSNQCYCLFHTRFLCTLELFTSKKVYGTREIYEYRQSSGAQKKSAKKRIHKRKNSKGVDERLMSVLFMVPGIFLRL